MLDYANHTMVDVCKITIQKPTTSPCPCEGEPRGNPISVLADQKTESITDLPALAGGFSVSRAYRSGVVGGGDRFNWNWINHTLTPSGITVNPAQFPDWCFPHDIQVRMGSQPIYKRCLPVMGYTANYPQSVLIHDASGEPKELEVKAGSARTLDRRREFWKGVGSDGLASYFLLDENNQLLRYSAEGALLSTTWPNGQQSVFAYPQGATWKLPYEVRDSFGRSYAFQYNADGLVTTVTDMQGGGVSYEYVSLPLSQCAGRSCKLLSAAIYSDGTSRQYLYNEAGFAPGLPGQAFLTGKLDERGVRVGSYSYDAAGRPVATTSVGAVNQHQVTYPANANQRTIQSPLGINETIDFDYFAGYRLTSSRSHVDAGVTVRTAMSYDANGNVESVDDYTNTRVCRLFDLSRNLEAARVEGLAMSTTCSTVTAANAALPANSRKVSTNWHPDWRLSTRTAEPGRITTSIYNGQADPFNAGAIASCAPSTALLPDGKPIAVLCKQVEQATTDTDGHLGFSAALQSGVPTRTNSWTYNQYGQVLTAKGPRTDVNDTTSYAYYADTTADHTKGDLQTMTNAAGKVTSYTQYNKHGQVLQSQDPNGVVTVNTYDLRQRLKSTTVAGQTTSYDYDAVGQLKKVTLPDQSWVGYDYDDAHRQVAVYDNQGNRSEYVLDNAGNKTAENIKDPSGNLKRQLSRSIDALGRVQQTTGRE
ncbi:MAG: RHS repeat protein [Rhizobacter sp.]